MLFGGEFRAADANQDVFWSVAAGTKGIDVSNAVQPHSPAQEQFRAFELPAASATAIRYGPGQGDVLDTREGASVNCESLEACFHGCGTHTECVGHIVKERVSVNSCTIPLVIPALLVTVKPELQSDGDRIVTAHCLHEACSRWPKVLASNQLDALVVRVLGGTQSCIPEAGLSRAVDLSRDFSGSNPPYFESAATQYMVECLGVTHLVVDLPSVDREESSNAMPNHSLFFGLEPGCKDLTSSSRPNATITELAALNVNAGSAASLIDGPYLLSLQVAPIEMDAAPSRPVLFPARLEHSQGKRISRLASLAGFSTAMAVLLMLTRRAL